MSVSVQSYLQCISKFSGFVFRVCIFKRKETKGKKVHVVKNLSSAGAYAIDGYNTWVHQSHLLVLIHTELVTAASSPFEGSDFHVGFGTWWQKESDASGDQHVPDAVDVEVVLLCLHKGVQGHCWRGDRGAGEQEKHPALPGRWVTAAPAEGAHSPGDGHDAQSEKAGTQQIPEAMTVQL